MTDPTVENSTSAVENDVASTKEAISKSITDLALKLVEQADVTNATPTVFFNALAMAFVTSYVATQTSQGRDVEEADLARAIHRFSGTLVMQAKHLLNFQPELLSTEKSRIILTPPGYTLP